MLCVIAETFHRLPHEIAALPLSEYRLMRNYVLATKYVAKPDEDDTETWGESELAKAPWETEVVTLT